MSKRYIEVSAEWPGRAFFTVIVLIATGIVFGIWSESVLNNTECWLQWMTEDADAPAEVAVCVGAMESNGINYYRHRKCAERLSEVKGFKCQ